LFFAYYNVGAGKPLAAFADLAHHYMKNELSEHADTVDPKARTTIYIHRHILNDYLVPRWVSDPKTAFDHDTFSGRTSLT
jgi:hypothetical protein